MHATARPPTVPARRRVRRPDGPVSSSETGRNLPVKERFNLKGTSGQSGRPRPAPPGQARPRAGPKTVTVTVTPSQTGPGDITYNTLTSFIIMIL